MEKDKRLFNGVLFGSQGKESDQPMMLWIS